MESEVDATTLVEEFIRSEYSDVVAVHLDEVPGQDGDRFHIRLWRATLRFEGPQRNEIDIYVTDTVDFAHYAITTLPRTLHAGTLLRKYGLNGLKERIK